MEKHMQSMLVVLLAILIGMMVLTCGCCSSPIHYKGPGPDAWQCGSYGANKLSH